MAYHPVLFTPRICQFCGDHFEAKDRRRIYCSSSCNTLAWMARRKKVSSSKPKKVATGDLSFSMQNVLTVAAGSGLATAGNYVFNDAPFYESLAQHLRELFHNQGYQKGQLERLQRDVKRLTKALVYALPDVGTSLHLQQLQEGKP